MKELFTHVYSVLVKYPQSRDNDRFLTMCVWNLECPQLKGSQYKDFQDAFLSEKITYPHIIISMKLKIQDKYFGLQGKEYIKPIDRKNKK